MTKYNPKFNINPTGGFNRLSLSNPFNNFSTEFNMAYLAQNQDKFNQMNLENNKIELKEYSHHIPKSNNLDSDFVEEKNLNSNYIQDNSAQRIEDTKNNNIYPDIKNDNMEKSQNCKEEYNTSLRFREDGKGNNFHFSATN